MNRFFILLIFAVTCVSGFSPLAPMTTVNHQTSSAGVVHMSAKDAEPPPLPIEDMTMQERLRQEATPCCAKTSKTKKPKFTQVYTLLAGLAFLGLGSWATLSGSM